MKKRRSLVLVVVASLSWSLLASPLSSEPPTGPTSIERGRLLFSLHCGGCHGREARGDGPVAEHLRIHPADLTVLGREAKGRFPRQRVYWMIDGREEIPTHVSRGMPVWGLSLREPGLDSQRQEDVTKSIWDLVDFLETLQRP